MDRRMVSIGGPMLLGVSLLVAIPSLALAQRGGRGGMGGGMGTGMSTRPAGGMNQPASGMGAYTNSALRIPNHSLHHPPGSNGGHHHSGPHHWWWWDHYGMYYGRYGYQAPSAGGYGGYQNPGYGLQSVTAPYGSYGNPAGLA